MFKGRKSLEIEKIESDEYPHIKQKSKTPLIRKLGELSHSNKELTIKKKNILDKIKINEIATNSKCSQSHLINPKESQLNTKRFIYSIPKKKFCQNFSDLDIDEILKTDFDNVETFCEDKRKPSIFYKILRENKT